MDIPAGARYVALHYITQYIYQLFIDELYIGEAGQFSPVVGYNVYRGDVKPNDQLMTENTITISDLDFGTYTYTVESVYENGGTGHATATVTIEDSGILSPDAAQPTIRVANGILIVNGSFDHLAITTASGILMAQHPAATDFALPLTDFAPGIYVVTIEANGTTQAAKVILTK